MTMVTAFRGITVKTPQVFIQEAVPSLIRGLGHLGHDAAEQLADTDVQAITADSRHIGGLAAETGLQLRDQLRQLTLGLGADAGHAYQLVAR